MNTQTITPVPATQLIEMLGKKFAQHWGTPDVTEHLRKVWALAKAEDPRWQDFLRLWKEEAPEELHMAVDVILSECPTREGFCAKPVLFGKFAMVRCGKPAAFRLHNSATLWCAEHVAEDCREPWIKGWKALPETSNPSQYANLPGESKGRSALAQTTPDYDAREVMSPSELRRAEAPKRAAGSQKVTEDGMYRNPATGEIFKVQFNRAEGDGRRLYAKRMIAWTEEGDEIRSFSVTAGAKATKLGRVSFLYAQGAMAKISPAWKLSLEEAKAFGALYETCIRCGKTLTLEESIERAMGSTCAKKFS